MHDAQRASGVAIDYENREKDDFYTTPPIGTKALLAVEKFEGKIWEPACGEGHISKVLIENGYEVESSDLVDRGYGQSRVDFLMEYKPRAPNIITNPPFKNATDFIRKSLALSSSKVALLMRLQTLEGSERAEVFKNSPLARIHVFSRRLTLEKNGIKPESSGMMAVAWFIWEHGFEGKPTINWI